MTSGGAQLSGGDDGADAVGKDDPIVHCGTEVRGVQFAKCCATTSSVFQISAVVCSTTLQRFAADVRRRLDKNSNRGRSRMQLDHRPREDRQTGGGESSAPRARLAGPCVAVHWGAGRERGNDGRPR